MALAVRAFWARSPGFVIALCLAQLFLGNIGGAQHTRHCQGCKNRMNQCPAFHFPPSQPGVIIAGEVPSPDCHSFAIRRKPQGSVIIFGSRIPQALSVAADPDQLSLAEIPTGPVC